MLHVKTPEEVLALIEREFAAVAGTELVSLSAAMGRVLAEDIAAEEYLTVPPWMASPSGRGIPSAAPMPSLPFCLCRGKCSWARAQSFS